MKKLYLIPFLFFLYTTSKAQTCSALNFTYTSAESRCVATGTITVNVTGGSGNYNYKAIGPVTTPSTSSNIISGLAPGFYTIIVKDMTTGCTKAVNNVQVLGDYNDPRFQLTKTDAGCAGNDGTVSVMNAQFGRSPFTYTIIAPSPSKVGTTSPTGNFSGLTPGEYVIQLMDSCGGIQVRRVTIENYTWWLDSVSVTRFGCGNANAFIRLKDNKGNVNTSGTSFSGFTYGYVIGTDTTWFNQNTFSLAIGNLNTLTLVAKDNCGLVHSTVWTFAASTKPSLGSVSLTSLGCASFNASVSGTNLTNPQFCLYMSGSLITCNSTGVFTNLVYGSYCIEMRNQCYDTIITRCFTPTRPVPSVGATVNITNKNCTDFTATITGQQNLYTPLYCLYDNNHIAIDCNSSGVFSNVPYGSYCIETHDNCTDSIITRCITVTRPVATLTSATVSNALCDSFRVSTSGSGLINPIYCLYDNLGNAITCNSTGVFTGINYGSYCIRAISCGDTTNTVCFTASRPTPAVGPTVVISNKQCATFSASITGQANLTNPEYCLYDASNILITCNSTGVFDGLAYGSYCIKTHNTCFDTTITRCFTQTQAKPTINTTMQLLNSACSTISIKVNGTNLTTPTYCLYDSVNTLLGCNFTGVFDSIPYGRYCVRVTDGCVDTTMSVCQTFSPLKGISLTTFKSCTISYSYLRVTFANGNTPYQIKVYRPDGSEAYSTATSSNPFDIQLPGLNGVEQYKVIGIDNCGNKDSAYITPSANIVTRNLSVRAKCPSAAWLNGAGDLTTDCSSNYNPVTPQIIKKDGVAFVKSYSSVTGTQYTFSDLEPATYIVEYTQTTCNSKVRDTVTIPPYAYPSQGQSAIYQCDNNSFSLGADVAGGVSPYSFQIIGSTPSSPSITTSPQPGPVFTINTGTTYSLVRLRTVDACGNATLSDVSVLPLQNISVTASNTCFFQNTTLSVDSIPNATYTWYRKTTPTDSVLVGSGAVHNLPFFVPEQIGDYVCKMVINAGCVTRIAHFVLDGQCGLVFLPAAVKLMGKNEDIGNQLYWNNPDEKSVLKYILERKRANEGTYSSIGTIAVHQGKDYSFVDKKPGSGMNYYRLVLVYADKKEYSNLVGLKSAVQTISVYPNPAKDKVTISIKGDRPAQYKIEILSTTGEIVYTTEIKNVASANITYTRKNSLPTGMYLVRITNIDANITEIRKLLFE